MLHAPLRTAGGAVIRTPTFHTLSMLSCHRDATRAHSALVRGISGGQAKRVNIALAMISQPPIIFLDELDALCPKRDAVAGNQGGGRHGLRRTG